MRTHSLLSRALVLASALAFAAPAVSQAAIFKTFGVGDLIKGSGPAVYYFGSDGRRYVFPNDKTYFTWYKDFSTVKQVSDGTLSTIPLARSNVTYHPGYKMVKITTDPRVYAVDQGGVLRHVATEQLAQTLFGANWQARIDDVPDAFFANYRVGTEIQTASDYKPADALTTTPTIAEDKQLSKEIANISIGTVDNGFVPVSLTVKRGTAVTWTNQDSDLHAVKGNGWGSSDLKYQDTYTKTFDSVGSFDYSDSRHAVMQGTINVVNPAY